MITILTIYAAVSVIFSVGFVAGAWWVARSRINEGAGLEVETIDPNHNAPVLVLRPRPSVFYSLRETD